MSLTPLRRRVRALERRVRQARLLARAFAFPYQPVVAQIIPTRRCNLSCGYCNEYDRVSDPVPLDELRRRIDRLAHLGTGIITLSGGEPLLHPDVAALIRHIRGCGAIATLITNGYLLTPAVIRTLNRSGLDSLQISIDNVHPDRVSKKSLKVLDRKLCALAALAEFEVVVNAVVGGGIPNPEDALVVAERARELGFHSTCGLIHDGSGQLQPLTAREDDVRRRIAALDRPLFSFDRYSRFQDALRDSRRAAGIAAPEAGISTSARTGWCTIVHSSVGSPALRCRSTRKTICAASTGRSSPVRRIARSGACIASR